MCFDLTCYYYYYFEFFFLLFYYLWNYKDMGNFTIYYLKSKYQTNTNQKNKNSLKIGKTIGMN